MTFVLQLYGDIWHLQVMNYILCNVETCVHGAIPSSRRDISQAEKYWYPLKMFFKIWEIHTSYLIMREKPLLKQKMTRF